MIGNQNYSKEQKSERGQEGTEKERTKQVTNSGVRESKGRKGIK